MVVLASLLAMACALVYVYVVGAPPMLEGQGIVSTWEGPWVFPGEWSLTLGICANLGIAMLLCSINKQFNVLRCLTMLQGSLFLCMQCAWPDLLDEFNPGLALCLAWLFCTMLMFSEFGSAYAQRRVFLSFAIISALASVVGAAVFFIPALWLATVQMRIFNLRTALASLMGIACPWIILICFGLADISALRVPNLVDFQVTMADMPPSAIAVLVFTIFVGAMAWVQNLVKYVSYTARYRAYQGYFAVAMLVALFGICCNLADSYALLPIFDVCVAMQVAHLFGVVHQQVKSYIPILLIIIIYLLLFVWRIVDYILL